MLTELDNGSDCKSDGFALSGSIPLACIRRAISNEGRLRQ